jgi:CubicO group peptidase (beta-lactamase class C family)
MSEVIIAGFVKPGFEPVRAAFTANFAHGEELGASFAAIVDGETVLHLWGGFADRAASRPWTADTLVPVYSTTKPIAGLVIARLVERGLLDYERPLADVWPAFGASGKDQVTLAQALSHQAGVPGFPDPIDPGLWLDPPGLGAALAALAPLWPPGSANGYHPLTYGAIAGEAVSRAAGRSLGTILREDIAGPAGIDFHIGTPDGLHGRCAEIARPKDLPELGEITPIKRAAFLTHWAAPNRGGAEWRRAEIPSANGHGTALSVAQLYAAFSHRGQLMGAPAFSPDVIAAMSRRRVLGPDLVLPFVMDFAAGAMRNNAGLYGPNPETIAHSGWGGSCGFADPARRLSGAYVMNRQSNALQGDRRARRLIDALFSCLG